MDVAACLESQLAESTHVVEQMRVEVGRVESSEVKEKLGVKLGL